MFYALLALLDEGDEAIYPDPGFPIYSSMIDFAGARGVPLALREENDFQPDLDELRRLVSPRTKVIVLNSPNNPTGGVLSRDAIRDIAAIARERDLWVLTDEIYGELVYDGEHRSIAVEDGMAERTILLDGFSKTFAMTGWRLGYGVFPRALVEPVAKLVTNSVSCTATFVQRAGTVALSSRPPEIGSPNGISLSPDQKTLAVSDYRGASVFTLKVADDGSLSDKAAPMTMKTPEPAAGKAPSSGGDGTPS